MVFLSIWRFSFLVNYYLRFPSILFRGNSGPGKITRNSTTELFLANMKTSVQSSWRQLLCKQTRFSTLNLSFSRLICAQSNPNKIQKTTRENGMFRVESLCPSLFRGTWMCGDPYVKRCVCGWVGAGDSHVKRCVGGGEGGL